MVGVGEIPLSKPLGDGRKLVLYMGWESDEGLVEGMKLDGHLPGPGCTDYLIGIAKEGELDYEEELQELKFEGGGDLNPLDPPPVVREAFNGWYERLRWETVGNEYHADAAARGENPYYPGLEAVPPGGYRHPNSTGVWKMEARAWFEKPKGEDVSVTQADVEVLYAAGAVNVDLTFSRVGNGCEVTPPKDLVGRRRLVKFVILIGSDRGDYDRTGIPGEEHSSWLKQAAEDVTNLGPWTVV